MGTLCAPAGLVRRADSGGSGSGCGCGRTGVQSGEGGHTQDLKKRQGERNKTGFEEGRTGTKEE